MNHEKWDDEKIEKLLSNVPKIHDHRSKDDVLKRLIDEGVFEEKPVDKKPNKKKMSWIPFAVSTAAILLLAILIPSLMGKINNSSISMEDSETSETSELSKMADEATNRSISGSVENDASMSSFMTQALDLKTAVYPEDLEGNTLFQLGLASDAANSVPVSVLIPNEQIIEIFGKTEPTGVELYNHYAPLFNESALGFTEYHPYVGAITEQGNRVIVTLPAKQPYDVASASLATYQASLYDTFNYYYDEAVFLKEDGSPFEFSQVGEASTPFKLTEDNAHYSYFKHTQVDGSEYLVPNVNTAYETVQKALLGMLEETTDIYDSVIIPQVKYTVDVQGDVVTVTFNDKIDLMNYDQQDTMQMIEGILLTASSFHKQVKFENIVQIDWEGFNFENPLPMPIGANQIPYSSAFQ